jgi:hypothetical protein
VEAETDVEEQEAVGHWSVEEQENPMKEVAEGVGGIGQDPTGGERPGWVPRMEVAHKG